MAIVLQVLDRRAEDLAARLGVRQRRHAQVAEPRRVRADEHDLAAELVGRPLAFLALEVLVQVAEGDPREGIGPAPPGEHDVVGVRQRITEIHGDPRRERRQLPAADTLPQVVAPADAVLVGKKVDGSGAPQLRRQDERRDDRDARLRVGAGPAHQADERRYLGGARALLRIEAHHRVVDVVVARGRLDERLVALRPEPVRLREHDVEDDGPRLLRGEPLYQGGVHLARPGEAAGADAAPFHRDEAFLVDVDEDDFGIGRERRRLVLDEGVEHPILEASEKVESKQLERRDHEHRGGERLHSLRRRQISALRVAWLRV